jgi:NADPH-ferrihemoprotein reductase
VVVNRELHEPKSSRSCCHVEFDLSGSRLRYEAGDHAGIFPTNDAELVAKLAKMLDVDLGQQFKLINLDGELYALQRV